MRHCPACGAPLTGSERFCPARGTEIGIVALDPLGTPTPTSDSAVVASPPRRGLRRGLILAGVALAGIVGWLLTQRYPGLVALDTTIIGLGAGGAVAISPTDGSSRTIIDGSYVEYLGDDGQSLLTRVNDPNDQQVVTLIRDDGQAIDVHPDAAAHLLLGPSAVHDGHVVIDAGQGVGLIDPTTGTGRLVGEGGLVAANRDLLIRVVCQPDLHCNWIIGDYAGNQQRIITAPSAILAPFSLGTVSADGTVLLQVGLGPDVPVLQAIDLTTGSVRPVDNSPDLGTIFQRQFAVTHDGHWLIARTTSGDVELISLADATRQTLQLNLLGAVQALTITR